MLTVVTTKLFLYKEIKMSLTRPDLLYFPNFFTLLAEGLIGTASVAPY